MSCDCNYSVYDDSPDICILDYMSDEELDEYEDYWKEQLNEMSKLL